MEKSGPEAALLRTRLTYGRELEMYARLEFPDENYHWVGKPNRADLSGVLSVDLPKPQSIRARFAKLWLSLRPVRGRPTVAPDVAMPRVTTKLEATAGHAEVRPMRSISTVPLAALGTTELQPEFGINTHPVSALPAFRALDR